MRAVLHHLMESFQKFEENPDGESWKKEFIKAKEEHLMRCIIDCYDAALKWIEHDMNNLLKPYTTADVALIFPSYYDIILPFFNDLRLKLSEARTSRNGNLISVAKEDLIRAGKFKGQVLQNVEKLERHIVEQENKEKEKGKKRFLSRTASSLISGLICLIIGLFARPYVQSWWDNNHKLNAAPSQTLPVRVDSASHAK